MKHAIASDDVVSVPLPEKVLAFFQRNAKAAAYKTSLFKAGIDHAVCVPGTERKDYGKPGTVEGELWEEEEGQRVLRRFHAGGHAQWDLVLGDDPLVWDGEKPEYDAISEDADGENEDDDNYNN